MRIDLLNRIDGVTFAEARGGVVRGRYGSVEQGSLPSNASGFFAFNDDSGEVGELYVANMQFRNDALTAGEVAALGGAAPGPIPVPEPAGLAFAAAAAASVIAASRGRRPSPTP